MGYASLQAWVKRRPAPEHFSPNSDCVVAGFADACYSPRPFRFFLNGSGRLFTSFLETHVRGATRMALADAFSEAVRGCLSAGGGVSELTSVLNARFWEAAPNQASAFFCGWLDLGQGCLQYAKAGHYALLIRHSGEVCCLDESGPPLGLAPDVDYFEATVPIAPDDVVMIYNRSFSLEFLADRLIEAARACPGHDVRRLRNHIAQQWSAAAGRTACSGGALLLLKPPGRRAGDRLPAHEPDPSRCSLRQFGRLRRAVPGHRPFRAHDVAVHTR